MLGSWHRMQLQISAVDPTIYVTLPPPQHTGSVTLWATSKFTHPSIHKHFLSLPIIYKLPGFSHSDIEMSDKHQTLIMMGQKFLAGGNWKLNGNEKIIDGIIDFMNAGPLNADTEVAVGPPSCYLEYVHSKLKVTLESLHRTATKCLWCICWR